MNDKQFLIVALEQAIKGAGRCAPNPAVGAVIVKAGRVIASGYHRGVGQDHAEVDAIKQCDDAKGATIYVTLEPCCHYGRTPPCTKAIIEAGITRVVFGCRDPHRHTIETGEQVLKKAGVSCDYCPVTEMTHFYRYYFYWLKTKTPWLTAKLAVSFDGKIAGAHGKPVKITGHELDQLTHQRRLYADGILTTVKTIMADDPQLTVRLNNIVIKKPLFILDSQGDLPLMARVIATAQSITIFHRRDADSEKIKNLRDKQVTCVAVDYDQGLDLNAVKSYLAQLGLHHVWIEAGGIATTGFLQARLLNEFILYIAPILLGPQAVRAFSAVIDFERCAEEFNVILCGYTQRS